MLHHRQHPQGYHAGVVHETGRMPHGQNFPQPDPAYYITPSIIPENVTTNITVNNLGVSNFGSECPMIMGSTSKIIPVLLHDPTMVSPVPSSCSSVDSSSTLPQSSPAAVNASQPTLSTFQYLSPNHENNSLRLPQTGMKKSSRLVHLPQSAESYLTRDGSGVEKLDCNLSAQVMPQTYENLGIDLEKLPPPEMAQSFTCNADNTVNNTGAHHVLDHRENLTNDDNDSGTPDTATIRRSKRVIYSSIAN